ncbi:MAG: Rne/Rng family ribonuclease [Alphaproteobacteria bacterium]|nr:Rne/Rng family ribonuclease [Alphaproteobacteria bacterium]
MPKRMLIDASHPEETRVVVLDGQRVDEFDFEAASKRPLKGNIYLAKVTRVEPSLQAAFVEYGGNRQGFLAFSEIHPDYYQIPVADRQALLAEQQEEARRRADDEFESVATGTALATDEELETEQSEQAIFPGADLPGEDITADTEPAAEHESDSSESSDEGATAAAEVENADTNPVSDTFSKESYSVDGLPAEEHPEEHVESALQDDVDPDHGASGFEEPGGAETGLTSAGPDSHSEHDAPAQPLRSQRPPQRWVRRRHYKIQEVIKRKQIMLVQVVKEERGTKGAALTTYLSLAGRYCVLMPNTPRGGGISRKITNAVDRNRLKAAAATLELPEGMGLIIRTAGANRTKLEIKRDYEYLLRMWDQIRELTLQSNAPACVYEEGDIVKRAIRDLYNKDVSEITVEGEDGYKNAKDFMRMLMPSHAKNVKLYRDTLPLFQKYHIEAQLDAMFQPTVTLKSGGYIVINQTEALVSIDVNSGRATREHSIEETAHKTNLEAADEIGRQLRLRDLAGLIVIDFIDMEDGRNDRDVEKRLRDAVKNDRARVQIGKISQFGLLEMSRQRLRAGVVAGSTVPCPHCAGQGIVRSVESTALRVLRALDEEGQRARAAAVSVRVASDVALYTLNQKRRELARIETDYDLTISFEPKDDLVAGHFDLERTAQRTAPPPPHPQQTRPAISADAVLAAPTDMPEADEEETTEDDTESAGATAPSVAANGTQPAASGKKRRRRRRGRGGSTQPQQPHAPAVESAIELAPAEQSAAGDAEALRTDAGVTHGIEARNNGAEPGTASGPQRRRRRRRKPRSAAANGASHSGQTAAAAENDTEAADIAGKARGTSPFGESVVPNAPSEPVWSLAGERADAASHKTDEPAGEMFYRREELPQASPVTPEPAVDGFDGGSGATHATAGERYYHRDDSLDATLATGTAQDVRVAAEPPPPQEAAKPEEPQKPQRRGWWQRPFKS